MIHEAIRRLYPNVHTITTDASGETAYDKDGNIVDFDIAQVNIESDKLLEEIKATQYKSLRSKEYPQMKDFADAMYWASQGDTTKLDEYYAACQAVKAKYPKP
jgi:hypothetical protein